MEINTSQDDFLSHALVTHKHHSAKDSAAWTLVLDRSCTYHKAIMPSYQLVWFCIMSAGHINTATFIPRAAQTRGEILSENSYSLSY